MCSKLIVGIVGSQTTNQNHYIPNVVSFSGCHLTLWNPLSYSDQQALDHSRGWKGAEGFPSELLLLPQPCSQITGSSDRTNHKRLLEFWSRSTSPFSLALNYFGYWSRKVSKLNYTEIKENNSISNFFSEELLTRGETGGKTEDRAHLMVQIKLFCQKLFLVFNSSLFSRDNILKNIEKEDIKD